MFSPSAVSICKSPLGQEGQGTEDEPRVPSFKDKTNIRKKKINTYLTTSYVRLKKQECDTSCMECKFSTFLLESQFGEQIEIHKLECEGYSGSS